MTFTSGKVKIKVDGYEDNFDVMLAASNLMETMIAASASGKTLEEKIENAQIIMNNMAQAMKCEIAEAMREAYKEEEKQ